MYWNIFTSILHAHTSFKTHLSCQRSIFPEITKQCFFFLPIFSFANIKLHTLDINNGKKHHLNFSNSNDTNFGFKRLLTIAIQLLCSQYVVLLCCSLRQASQSCMLMYHSFCQTFQVAIRC